MPIRPENRARYGADWAAISLEVKERAQWQCECAGECGRGTHTGRCPNRHGAMSYSGTKVVLTTAHLDHTPENNGEPGNRPNLKAMCQGCHLHYDRDHHRETAYMTRRSRTNTPELFRWAQKKRTLTWLVGILRLGASGFAGALASAAPSARSGSGISAAAMTATCAR